MLEQRLDIKRNVFPILLFVCFSNKFWKSSSILDLVTPALVWILLNIDIYVHVV